MHSEGVHAWYYSVLLPCQGLQAAALQAAAGGVGVLVMLPPLPCCLPLPAGAFTCLGLLAEMSFPPGFALLPLFQ